ncbi:cilia- and flagella-associated protein 54-like [Gigantopelta aegis]|uniref:cilia- and flagella-associated protein 54-like n=1 Tax=Gigantopelta aegis TaxID=1735272 RepID=UPI001B8892E2|nr:cilia- and flagella-associated protein 54-like [Gigantopelta aegis]
MAAFRKLEAVNRVKSKHGSYYLKDTTVTGKPNPVYQALDQEISMFVGYMKKRSSPNYKKPDDESYSRPYNTLFDLWNKFEPRLPKVYYQEKLLEVGDFLITIKEYQLALWQCYDRYLQFFGDINVHELTDVNVFRKIFFPNGLSADNIGLTFRALMGKSISSYRMVKMSDPKLQNKQSVDRCVDILAFLRLVMQVILPKESLCWLVYNGTIHIYNMSRHIMLLGHSAKVLEFLLWACMCMETSVPLMGVKYIPWRSTLYTAVCQCYYDCKAGQHAEAFARRGLLKINELSKLESISSSHETHNAESSFRLSAVKMAIMVYKRSVMETRRKPKGLLRPKTRANLRDAMNQPWPRTPSEKLLSEMFEGSAAQFLAILESIQDTNRRIVITSPPAADNEPEILDVFCELFLAAQEILAGGGGLKGVATTGKPMSVLGGPPLAAVTTDKELMEMVTLGQDGVSLSAVVRVVKWAYNYEQWDTFDSLVEPVLSQLKSQNDDVFVWDIKALELLLALQKLNVSNRRFKRLANQPDEEKEEGANQEPTTQASQIGPPPSAVTGNSSVTSDDLVNLAGILMSVVTGPYLQEKIEIDMIVDAGLFLWSKCKAVFQKYQTGSVDNYRYLSKMEHPTKWIYLLDAVHQVLCWCGISSVDPGLTAEVVIRLALVYESSSQVEGIDELCCSKCLRFCEENVNVLSGLKDSKTSLTDLGMSNENDRPHPAKFVARNHLLQAREILELGLKNVSFARQAVALNDIQTVADVSWVKRIFEMMDYVDVFPPETLRNSVGDLSEDLGVNMDKFMPANMKGSATAVWNTVKDLHLELILMHHRVCLKLADLGPDPRNKNPKSKRVTGSEMMFGSDRQVTDTYVESFDELCSKCNKNNLSKAVLYMQKAILNERKNAPVKTLKELLEEAVSFIKKAQAEEKRLYLDNLALSEQAPQKIKVPPPPILLSRRDTTMVFKPAPFIPAGGQKVAWYRLFGRSASGSNVKVRINDYFLQGTGEEIPAFDCELRVSGLCPNERYIFAVGAYTSDGRLIGDAVGESSRPILASHPLPVLMTWALLSQIAYQSSCFQIAKQACSVLWDHFVAEVLPPQGDTFVTTVKKDFKLTPLRLNQRALSLSSPVLLRQFLTSIFIGVDIDVREGELFCDVLSDKGPLYSGQMKRLGECERLIVAMELAGWLNEANSALQAVIQCYGLLAPLLFYKIPSRAVIQVLIRCHAVMQEVPTGLIQKRQGQIADSLHHMIACITFHMVKVLRTWGQKKLANDFNDAGRRLLALDERDEKKSTSEVDKTDKVDTATIGTDGPDTASNALQALKRKKSRKGGPTMKVDEPEGPVNEELKALEANMLSMSKAAHGEHELTGSEDPNILHAYTAYLPSKLAYKEVVKFKRRARYLEFFVHVCQNALTEGFPEQVIEWCEDSMNWLQKRNEQIIGPRAYMSKQPGVITVSGDDPKKFSAAMLEYRKEKEGAGKTKTSPKRPALMKKKQKYKPLRVTTSMSDASKKAQEETELAALEVLALYLPDLYHTKLRRRRMRKIANDEMPWRCMLNINLGLSHFGTFLQKLEKREKVLGSSGSNMYKTNFLDQEWFTFETACTLVVGWDGGPSPQSAGKPPEKVQLLSPTVMSLDLAVDPEKMARTGIEMAAAVVTGVYPTSITGVAPHPVPSIHPERDEVHPDPNVPHNVEVKHYPQIDPDTSPLSTKATTEALCKTFMYFKRAVILAHRGQHWTLLQNSARALWNCAHTALLRAFTPNQGGQDAGLLAMDVLRSLLWLPLHTAADCLLDMMVNLQADLDSQASKAKVKGKHLGSYFESWMGDMTSEKGGASLRFESPLDDKSIVDLRWIRRLCLRVLELLYHEQKWEKLVDIALRFNALTNDRYAEQVIPLMVQAQRKLTLLIEGLHGLPPPQPHFVKLQRQLGEVITAKDYLKCQLTLATKPPSEAGIELGAQIDPEGHNAHCFAESQRLVSVPLDVLQSLETFRKALDQTNYTSRALRHARKLLVLYLAGQQNESDGLLSKQTSKVDFVPMTAQPQRTIPPDLSLDQFMSASDVQTTPIPRSQFGTVLGAYDRTIDLLLSKGQKGLASQALRELGNLCYHSGNLRGAFRYWSDSLDIVLNMTNCLKMWRSQLSDAADISSELMKRCGLWGCIHGGVLASNIAQYILTSDLGLRIESCFLAGYFFKALFRSSLPHPTADQDYALYEVGEGCEVTNLIPGIDLLSDRFRTDGRQLVSALRWVTEELARGRHNLFVLPLLTLYQYLTTFMCRDLQRTVDGRVLKVRVLTDLGLFSAALITLQRLLHGERLPHTADNHFRQVESKMSSIRFNTEKPITNVNNLKVLESVLDKRLSSSLATLYGAHMTCHLSIVQAHLFVTLADTIPVLPSLEEFNSIPDGGLRAYTISTISRGGLGNKGPQLDEPSLGDMPSTMKERDDVGSGYASISDMRRFTGSRNDVTLEGIKGTLVGIADKMMSTISEVILENADHDKAGVEGLSAAELELVVLCKLEQAAIARQKHHAPLAARIVFSALKLLQSADIFKPKKEVPPPPRDLTSNTDRPSSMRHPGDDESRRGQQPVDVRLVEPENSQFQYQNFQSRSRLDARLWLDCRLVLVKSLLMQIQGMGDVKGPDNKVLNELSDCRQYCAEGLCEAEACGDVEMQAEFYAQAAHLNIIEGKSLQHTTQLLLNAIEHLHKLPTLSNVGEHLLAVCLIFKMDLEAVNRPEHDSDLILEKSLHNYIYAQKIILKQMENLGQKIEHYNPEGEKCHLSSPVNPIENIYLPHMLRLTQVKLRIGHAMARSAARKIRSGIDSTDHTVLWSNALGVLTTALEISKISITREANLEAEILFMMGKVQKMLVLIGKFSPRAAVSTLLDAIKISYCNDHDLGLIRQAYLEIAAIYLYSSRMMKVQNGIFLEVTSDEKILSSRHKSPSPKRQKGKSQSPVSKRRKEETLLERENDRQAAWTAIRCAAVTAQSQRSRMQLIGDVKVTTQKLSERALKNIPEFAALDLVSSYVLGEKKKVYKKPSTAKSPKSHNRPLRVSLHTPAYDEIEEELAPLIAAQEVKQVETYEDQINKAKKEAHGLGWIHILGYQTILQRLCSTSTICISSKQNTSNYNGGDLGPEFDLGFISHAQFDTTLNHDVVRSMLFSGTWSVRLNQMHSFLNSNLPIYAFTCCAMAPPARLRLTPVETRIHDLPITVTPYFTSSMENDPYDENSEETKECMPPGYRSELLLSDRKALAPDSNELIIQWYQPSLEEGDPLIPDMGSVDRRIIMFYARSKGNMDDQVIFPSFLWISHPQLHDLHDRLAVLAQRAEISLLKKEKQKESTSGTSIGKSKKTQRIKALSPKPQRDEKLEALLQQCLDDCAILLGTPPLEQEPTTTEIPFEVSRTNIKNLEQLFDPSFGLILKGTDILQWLTKMFPIMQKYIEETY